MNAMIVSRRKFLKGTGVIGGGLVVGFTLPGCSSSEPPLAQIEGAFAPNAFLQITPASEVRFYCPRDEMGQGVTTGLTTVVAEELDIDPNDITVAFAGVHSAYSNPAMGVQATGGSNAMNAHYHQLRQVGADVRALIVAAAAQQLGVAQSDITTAGGHVIVRGVRKPYGDFIATAATLPMPEDTPLKQRSEFKHIGRDFPRLDSLEKATGTAPYGIDIEIPGMHYAVVRRSPVAGAQLLEVDKSRAAAMPGVTDIVEISSGVAVVAEKFWQAKQAAQALELKWQEVPLGAVSTSSVLADYQQALTDAEGVSTQEEGDFTDAIAAAEQTHTADYWTPYLAHAPLEPMNAVLRIENGVADIWTGNQGPIGVQGLVARFAGLDSEQVRVHNLYLGGGFGRRGTLTHVIEVTQVVMATAKPIKLVWTREDDIRNGLYRPASLVRINAGLNAAGDVTAWRAERAGGDITPETLRNLLPALFPGMGDGISNFLVSLSEDVFSGFIPDPTSIEGLAEGYDLPNREVKHYTVEHGLPLTFWRSVGHSNNAFAKESMTDELAELAGVDPVEFRLRNTRNNPRLHNVIKVAGERMRAMRPPPGHYLGFAAHGSFGSDVAEIAEVSVERGRIRVHRVTCVIDCGIAVTPDVVRAQMEGGVVFALTAALHGKVDLRDGEVVQSNFHDYPLLRMNEAPEVDVIIIDSDTDPTGVGEPGVPPLAPAVANAVYAATGQRLRSLPLELA